MVWRNDPGDSDGIKKQTYFLLHGCVVHAETNKRSNYVKDFKRIFACHHNDAIIKQRCFNNLYISSLYVVIKWVNSGS